MEHESRETGPVSIEQYFKSLSSENKATIENAFFNMTGDVSLEAAFQIKDPDVVGTVIMGFTEYLKMKKELDGTRDVTKKEALKSEIKEMVKELVDLMDRTAYPD